jgi:uncharacterized protein (TIGR03083 family)
MDFLMTARRQMLAGQKHDARQRLLASFDGLTEEQLLQPGACGQWSVRDVLAHIAAWDRATTEALRAMLAGQRHPLLDMDEDGVQAFNEEHHLATAHVPLSEVVNELHASREELLALLREVDNATLFAPAPGDEHADSSMAAIVQVQSDHDQEHAEMIEQWRETGTGG